MIFLHTINFVETEIFKDITEFCNIFDRVDRVFCRVCGNFGLREKWARLKCNRNINYRKLMTIVGEPRVKMCRIRVMKLNPTFYRVAFCKMNICRMINYGSCECQQAERAGLSTAFIQQQKSAR